jgi:hypothetical protein
MVTAATTDSAATCLSVIVIEAIPCLLSLEAALQPNGLIGDRMKEFYVGIICGFAVIRKSLLAVTKA